MKPDGKWIENKSKEEYGDIPHRNRKGPLSLFILQTTSVTIDEM